MQTKGFDNRLAVREYGYLQIPVFSVQVKLSRYIFQSHSPSALKNVAYPSMSSGTYSLARISLSPHFLIHPWATTLNTIESLTHLDLELSTKITLPLYFKKKANATDIHDIMNEIDMNGNLSLKKKSTYSCLVHLFIYWYFL